MPRLTDAEIAEVTGRPAPAKEAPANRIEDTLGKLDELDGRMSALTEKHRQPGESHEAAQNRILMENPRLYSEHKKQRAAILGGQGIGDIATGGVV